MTKKLPKNAKVGSEHTIIVNKKRAVTFKRTKKTGFGKWKIISNKKLQKKKNATR